MMPTPNPHDSEQNAFVQQWLLEWEEATLTRENLAAFYRLPVEHVAIETLYRKKKHENLIKRVIEHVQGTYDYTDHELRQYGQFAPHLKEER
jgi:hypothetical protein